MMRESQFPFKNNRYRIPSGRKRTLALTKEEIKKIVYWHGDSESCYWRDMWLFSYLCNGINFRDMLFLKYDNIINGEIVFVRSKTAYNGKEKVIKAAITPLMYNIMERSGNGIDGPGDRYIFKFAKKNLSPMRVARIVRTAIFRCNHVLKAIADDIGIPHFTTYSARHSFATVMMRSGVDIQFISESLGHSNISITEHYLAGFDEDVRRMNARALTDF
jgi:integrase